MNLLVSLPVVVALVPFIPPFIEFFSRKDKGPRDIHEQSTYENRPEINISRLERARGEARAKEPSEVIRVVGNISIPDGTEVRNHLVVHGNLELGRNCRIHGSVKAFGNVEIGEDSVIDGHVLSEGKIHVGRRSTVNGVVDSLQEITLEENATVEAVSTERTVKLGPGARITRRILSGASIVTSAEQPQAPTTKATPRRLDLEPEKKKEKATDQIFEYLEDRIRKLDEAETRPIEGVRVEGLSPNEAKVLRLAYAGSSFEEMCLRLLMEPREVQEILNGLVRKGFLDENLRPKRPEPMISESKTPEAAQKEKDATPTEVRSGKESVSASAKQEKESSSVEEYLESLIASKMREELRKKMRYEKKDLRREWGEAYSAAWGTERKDGQNNPSEA